MDDGAALPPPPDGERVATLVRVVGLSVGDAAAATDTFHAAAKGGHPPPDPGLCSLRAVADEWVACAPPPGARGSTTCVEEPEAMGPEAVPPPVSLRFSSVLGPTLPDAVWLQRLLPFALSVVSGYAHTTVACCGPPLPLTAATALAHGGSGGGVPSHLRGVAPVAAWAAAPVPWRLFDPAARPCLGAALLQHVLAPLERRGQRCYLSVAATAAVRSPGGTAHGALDLLAHGTFAPLRPSLTDGALFPALTATRVVARLEPGLGSAPGCASVSAVVAAALECWGNLRLRGGNAAHDATVFATLTVEAPDAAGGEAALSRLYVADLGCWGTDLPDAAAAHRALFTDPAAEGPGEAHAACDFTAAAGASDGRPECPPPLAAVMWGVAGEARVAVAACAPARATASDTRALRALSELRRCVVFPAKVARGSQSAGHVLRLLMGELARTRARFLKATGGGSAAATAARLAAAEARAEAAEEKAAAAAVVVRRCAEASGGLDDLLARSPDSSKVAGPRRGGTVALAALPTLAALHAALRHRGDVVAEREAAVAAAAESDMERRRALLALTTVRTAAGEAVDTQTRIAVLENALAAAEDSAAAVRRKAERDVAALQQEVALLRAAASATAPLSGAFKTRLSAFARDADAVLVSTGAPADPTVGSEGRTPTEAAAGRRSLARLIETLQEDLRHDADVFLGAEQPGVAGTVAVAPPPAALQCEQLIGAAYDATRRALGIAPQPPSLARHSAEDAGAPEQYWRGVVAERAAAEADRARLAAASAAIERCSAAAVAAAQGLLQVVSDVGCGVAEEQEAALRGAVASEGRRVSALAGIPSLGSGAEGGSRATFERMAVLQSRHIPKVAAFAQAVAKAQAAVETLRWKAASVAEATVLGHSPAAVALTTTAAPSLGAGVAPLLGGAPPPLSGLARDGLRSAIDVDAAARALLREHCPDALAAPPPKEAPPADTDPSAPPPTSVSIATAGRPELGRARGVLGRPRPPSPGFTARRAAPPRAPAVEAPVRVPIPREASAAEVPPVPDRDGRSATPEPDVVGNASFLSLGSFAAPTPSVIPTADTPVDTTPFRTPGAAGLDRGPSFSNLGRRPSPRAAHPQARAHQAQPSVLSESLLRGTASSRAHATRNAGTVRRPSPTLGRRGTPSRAQTPRKAVHSRTAAPPPETVAAPGLMAAEGGTRAASVPSSTGSSRSLLAARSPRRLPASGSFSFPQ